MCCSGLLRGACRRAGEGDFSAASCPGEGGRGEGQREVSTAVCGASWENKSPLLWWYRMLQGQVHDSLRPSHYFWFAVVNSKGGPKPGWHFHPEEGRISKTLPSEHLLAVLYNSFVPSFHRYFLDTYYVLLIILSTMNGKVRLPVN